MTWFGGGGGGGHGPSGLPIPTCVLLCYLHAYKQIGNQFFQLKGNSLRAMTLIQAMMKLSKILVNTVMTC